MSIDIQRLVKAFKNKRRYLEHTPPKLRKNHPLGIITYELKSIVKSEEREVEKQSREGADLTPEPLFDKPNKYTGKKFCRSCKTWKLLNQFSPRAEMVDGKHSYCRDCRAAKARKNYPATYRWKRG